MGIGPILLNTPECILKSGSWPPLNVYLSLVAGHPWIIQIILMSGSLLYIDTTVHLIIIPQLHPKQWHADFVIFFVIYLNHVSRVSNYFAYSVGTILGTVYIDYVYHVDAVVGIFRWLLWQLTFDSRLTSAGILLPCEKNGSLEHWVYISQLTAHVTHFERCEAVLKLMHQQKLCEECKSITWPPSIIPTISQVVLSVHYNAHWTICQYMNWPTRQFQFVFHFWLIYQPTAVPAFLMHNMFGFWGFYFDYVKFAMLFNLMLTSQHWWIYSTQPGTIATIAKALSHSTARAEQWDNTALHHGSCNALICPDWVSHPRPNAAHQLPKHPPTA